MSTIERLRNAANYASYTGSAVYIDRELLLQAATELESLQAELRDATRYGKEKDETATVFMNQVKSLQAENAALRKQVAICPKCGNYFGGHATGGHDICDCHESD